MADTSLVQEQRAPDGTVAGVSLGARVFLPVNQGIVFVSPSGQMWELTVDDTGVMNINPLTLT